MLDPLIQINLQHLMKITEGNPNITIGLIDGPIDLNHPDFEAASIKSVKESQMIECITADSISCTHGTFIAGILCAKRGLSAPAICPACTLLLRPIFIGKIRSKNNDFKAKNNSDVISLPTSNPEELANAIVETVDKGAKIINLSLGLSNSSLTLYSKLQDAYIYARNNGVIIVAAAGNHGNIGGLSLIDNEWIIPVVACDTYGKLDPMSNIGPSIGIRGLMAPGINIISTFPGGEREYIRLSGTSFAAAFVTGAIALLWSVFPNASADQIVYSIRIASSYKKYYRSIIPRLLDVEAVYKILKHNQTT